MLQTLKVLLAVVMFCGCVSMPRYKRELRKNDALNKKIDSLQSELVKINPHKNADYGIPPLIRNRWNALSPFMYDSMLTRFIHDSMLARANQNYNELLKNYIALYKEVDSLQLELSKKNRQLDSAAITAMAINQLTKQGWVPDNAEQSIRDSIYARRLILEAYSSRMLKKLSNPRITESSANPFNDIYVMTFPNPPPEPTESIELISSKLKRCQKLRDIDSVLRAAFDKANYNEKYYFNFEGGFALATALEELDSDGTVGSRNQKHSFFADAKKQVETTMKVSEKYKRCIVFVISDKITAIGESNAPTHEELEQWYNIRYRKLKDNLFDKSSKGVEVIGLMYEYKKVANTHRWQFQKTEDKKTTLRELPIIKLLTDEN